MYLTRFRLNTARQGARRLLDSPQRMHAAVTMSFAEPPDPAPGAPRVLWRVDHTAHKDTLLYISGPQRPDLTHLVEQAGWPTTPEAGWKTYDYSTFLDKIADADVWAFRLTANPVHQIRRKPGEETKRTGHVAPRHQAAWLAAQGEKNGFELLERPAEQQLRPEDTYHLLVHHQRPMRFTKRNCGNNGKGSAKGNGGEKNQVSLMTATFDGLLRVTDASAFRSRLTQGLGKAKAYGCGLMTLVPPRRETP